MEEPGTQSSHRHRGIALERTAARYLVARGLRLITSNYHCRTGEIDLIMLDGDTLVFVEVRFRRNPSHGTPAETVTATKQRRLIRCARHYLMRHRLHEALPCRFDILGIGPDEKYQWIRNAFSQLPV